MLDRTNDQVEERLARLAALAEGGIPPWPYRFEPTATVSELRSATEPLAAEELEAEPPRAALAGRVLALRRMGRAGFADLSDGRARLQVYVRRDSVPAQDWAAWDCAHLGDWLGVTGAVMRTRTGELSLKAEAVSLLAKSLQPFPVPKTEVVDGRPIVHHAVVDKELRYRRRYFDLAVNPEVRRVFETRSRIVAEVRRFLDDRGFLEVETPVLQSLHGGASARPFVTSINALSGLTLYLRIALELHLKRLIVGGMERVYEVGRVFRNEGIDRTHNPEFTMLELYEAYADYGDMARLTEELVADVARRVLGTTRIEHAGTAIDLAPPWRRITMMDAIHELGGVRADLRSLSRETLVDVCRERGLQHDPRANAGLLLDLVFAELVQPKLVQPTFVLDYPKEVSPLAKEHRHDPRLTERFEAFVQGWEIANAFSELNDPIDQRRRFEGQAELRAAGDEEAQVLDEDFLTALEHGMPPTGGLGIGIDRLVMLLTDQASIRDVLLFPFMRPQDQAIAGPGLDEDHDRDDKGAEPR
jgi:lysyl-tRNA synthetase class 2